VVYREGLRVGYRHFAGRPAPSNPHPHPPDPHPDPSPSPSPSPTPSPTPTPTPIRYHAQLEAHIDAHPEFIQPTSRRNEIRERLRNDALRDLSVSRTTFSWLGLGLGVGVGVRVRVRG